MTGILRVVVLSLWIATPVKAAELTVFAAASLGEAMEDVADYWKGNHGDNVRLVLAGSATLARQIDAGAPADVFVSANRDWMTWLEGRGRINAATQVDIAGNALVLVANDVTQASEAAIGAAPPLSDRLGPDGRLAVALPEAVPAGIYARQALMALGQWDQLRPRLAPTDNVRAALALVALGEAPLGVVYQTDALAEPRVHIAGRFDASLHDPITYPAAVIADAREAQSASGFVAFLASDAGQEILATHGFLPVKAQR